MNNILRIYSFPEKSFWNEQFFPKIEVFLKNEKFLRLFSSKIFEPKTRRVLAVQTSNFFWKDLVYNKLKFSG